jgi:hypothetical protein
MQIFGPRRAISGRFALGTLPPTMIRSLGITRTGCRLVDSRNDAVATRSSMSICLQTLPPDLGRDRHFDSVSLDALRFKLLRRQSDEADLPVSPAQCEVQTVVARSAVPMQVVRRQRSWAGEAL